MLKEGEGNHFGEGRRVLFRIGDCAKGRIPAVGGDSKVSFRHMHSDAIPAT